MKDEIIQNRGVVRIKETPPKKEKVCLGVVFHIQKFI